MKVTILKIIKKTSKYGGFFYRVLFQGTDGRTYYSCISPQKRNYVRWKKVLKEGIILDNLKLVEGDNKLINADSNFKEIKYE